MSGFFVSRSYSQTLVMHVSAYFFPGKTSRIVILSFETGFG